MPEPTRSPMSMPTPRFARPAAATALALAVLSLAACGRPDADTRAGGPAQEGSMPASRVATDDSTGAARVAAAGPLEAARVPDTMAAAAGDTRDKVADAAITASVNAELARDNDLSALRIDVDTHNGHVMLSGSAPSERARERAARMASAVQGVTSVDNQLTVER